MTSTRTALAAGHTGTNMISVTEEEYRQQTLEIEALRAENENIQKLLNQCMTENDQLKRKLDQHEREQCSTRSGSRDESFYRTVADALCEELVLLDEDINFISTIVKPPEADPYTSNLGRKPQNRNGNTGSSTPDSSSVAKKSVSEQLLEEKLRDDAVRATPQHSLLTVPED